MSEFVPTRNIAYARIWTAQTEPVLPADLSDALYGRGFMPEFTDLEGENPPMMEAGLAEARFALGNKGYLIHNLTSSRGSGCRVTVDTATVSDLPDDYLARRTVPRPRLCYIVTAGGAANSDRNLCENIAEALLLQTSGLVELGGLGVKGNRPNLHNSSWVGQIKTITRTPQRTDRRESGV